LYFKRVLLRLWSASSSAMLLGTFSAHRDMLWRVRTENGAVPGMRAWCKAGAEYRTQVPRTASLEVLHRWWKIIHDSS
jgi:hypothetical protein